MARFELGDQTLLCRIWHATSDKDDDWSTKEGELGAGVLGISSSDTSGRPCIKKVPAANVANAALAILQGGMSPRSKATSGIPDATGALGDGVTTLLGVGATGDSGATTSSAATSFGISNTTEEGDDFTTAAAGNGVYGFGYHCTASATACSSMTKSAYLYFYALVQ
jgi:hypothetical protein